MQSKAEIRKTMLARRQGMSPEIRREACGYLCAKLMDITLPERSVIAVYLAVQGEVDIAPVITSYRARKNRVLLPIVSNPEKILRFAEWTPETKMTPGPYGILQPVDGEVMIPDVMIVPLVAFDRSGYRIGYGGGYYDATMAVLPGVITIGVGYGFQEISEIPVENHDMKLNMIVTEKEILSFCSER